MLILLIDQEVLHENKWIDHTEKNWNSITENGTGLRLTCKFFVHKKDNKIHCIPAQRRYINNDKWKVWQIQLR
jgi:hypothetical protein